MSEAPLRAPFPYFGGKSRIASYVWSRIGDVPNYVEPFLGSAAFLLARPDKHGWWGRVETVNDADGWVTNVWRAISAAPEDVAKWADGPVLECDLHARHAWLKPQGRGLAERLEGDPDFFDAKLAGWWLKGVCEWIGRGWCGPAGDGPWVVEEGRFVKRGGGNKRSLPHIGNGGQGVHRKLPHIGAVGRGVPDVIANYREHLTEYMQALANRFRRVRVCCGDWSRVLGPTPTVGFATPCGVIIDPPYALDERTEHCYTVDRAGVAAEVRQWCLEHGSDPRLRIALCGYTGEGHGALAGEGWEPWGWKTSGGYAGQSKTAGRGQANRHRECVWFSPACLSDEKPNLFNHES